VGIAIPALRKGVQGKFQNRGVPVKKNSGNSRRGYEFGEIFSTMFE
jgi:hypothetical protein